MLAATLLTLALASTALSAPNDRLTRCDISKAKLEYPANQAPLPAPTAPPSYISVAIGTQNYTCGASGTYTNVGAVAELFDIGCLYNTPAFDGAVDIAYSIWKALPPSLPTQMITRILNSVRGSSHLGQHFYVVNPITGTGVSPKWDFTSSGSTKGNPNAYVVAAKNTGFVAPTGKQDVDWVHLKSIAGKLATEIYRVETRGGQPPASCTPGQSKEIAVKYATQYWLMGSQL